MGSNICILLIQNGNFSFYTEGPPKTPHDEYLSKMTISRQYFPNIAAILIHIHINLIVILLKC
jgi:hypothetical protein